MTRVPPEYAQNLGSSKLKTNNFVFRNISQCRPGYRTGSQVLHTLEFVVEVGGELAGVGVGMDGGDRLKITAAFDHMREAFLHCPRLQVVDYTLGVSGK